MPELADRSFERGETFRGKLTIKNPDGTAKNLTGASVEWNLAQRTGAKVFDPSKTLGSGVSFEGAATLGVLVVEVGATESAGLGRSNATVPYDQEWVITDADGDRQIYRGRVVVGVSVLPVAA